MQVKINRINTALWGYIRILKAAELSAAFCILSMIF
jgi:hypothetical protein